MTVIEELGSLPERIEASANRLADLRAEIDAEIEIRNRLIVEANDHAGMKQRDIAKAAKISGPSVIRVLAGSSED